MGDAAAPASEKLGKYLSEKSHDRKLTLKIMESIGEKAIPELMKHIERQDNSSGQELESIGKNPNFDLEHRNSIFLKREVIRTLGKMGHPTQTVPGIITFARLRHPKTAAEDYMAIVTTSTDAIVNMGTEAIPVLINELQSKDEMRQKFAALVLVNFPRKTLNLLPGETLKLLRKAKSLLTNKNEP